MCLLHWSVVGRNLNRFTTHLENILERMVEHENPPFDMYIQGVYEETRISKSLTQGVHCTGRELHKDK